LKRELTHTQLEPADTQSFDFAMTII